MDVTLQLVAAGSTGADFIWIWVSLGSGTINLGGCSTGLTTLHLFVRIAQRRGFPECCYPLPGAKGLRSGDKAPEHSVLKK